MAASHQVAAAQGGWPGGRAGTRAGGGKRGRAPASGGCRRRGAGGGRPGERRAQGRGWRWGRQGRPAEWGPAGGKTPAGAHGRAVGGRRTTAWGRRMGATGGREPPAGGGGQRSGGPMARNRPTVSGDTIACGVSLACIGLMACGGPIRDLTYSGCGLGRPHSTATACTWRAIVALSAGAHPWWLRWTCPLPLCPLPRQTHKSSEGHEFPYRRRPHRHFFGQLLCGDVGRMQRVSLHRNLRHSGAVRMSRQHTKRRAATAGCQTPAPGRSKAMKRC